MQQDTPFNPRMEPRLRDALAAAGSAGEATAGMGLRMRRIAPGDPLGVVPRLRREMYFHE